MRILLGLVMLCGTAFGTPVPTITNTPTNGPTTVTVHARTTDGKLPVGVNFSLLEPSDTSPLGPPRYVSFSGTNGDWTATNVRPVDYYVFLRSPNYAEENLSFWVRAGTNYSINFVLSRGATFKGRVLDDATGKPIADQLIDALPSTRGPFCISTDAEGHYKFPPIAGAPEIKTWPGTNYVGQRIRIDEADEDSTVTVPDIRLKRGGRISGRVELPAGVESNFIFLTEIKFELQGPLPTNSVIDDVLTDHDSTFRTDPLPPGTYTLHAGWREFAAKDVPLQSWLSTDSVSNIDVIAGQDTTNVLIPTKEIILTNSTGGR
jgi:hypothetical protein